MTIGERLAQFRTMARQALADLFDQRKPFGRLALVQILMISGDTLVTISLAGTLFFSISPTEAKSKVFLYLVLTLAPFAVVSPLLGPLIDRSRGARRAMVVVSALGRAVICPFMARDVHSLLLFPLAFLILVFSKLYLVTRGALVPEMAAAGFLGPDTAAEPGDAPAALPSAGPGEVPGEVSGGAPPPDDAAAEVPPPGPPRAQYASLNARLTLLGTLAGFVMSIPAVIVLKLAGAPGVLIMVTFVFLAAAVAGLRLPVPGRARGQSAMGRIPGAPRFEDPTAVTGRSPGTPGPARRGVDDVEVDPDLVRLQPIAHPEVLLGLSANSLLRGLAGFLIFLLAFGLRRLHAGLWWYGFALGASGVGSLVGLLLVPRLRKRLAEQQIITSALVVVAVGAVVAAYLGDLPAQALLAFMVGVAGSVAQPSFDAMTQRLVPEPAQGRAFARFATRQQLVWCIGALIPVVIALSLSEGDVIMAVLAGAGAALYVVSRRALVHRALPPHLGSHGAGRR